MNKQQSFLETKPTVLLSLREIYYNEMLKGKKHYEYRTRYLKGESEAYIYISRTKKSIVAKIIFDRPIIGGSKIIAQFAKSDDESTYESILNYIGDKTGYAIPIKQIIKIKEVTLSEIKEKFPNFTIPQSYYSLDKKPELLEYLRSKEV